jgi:hypothetical protein
LNLTSSISERVRELVRNSISWQSHHVFIVISLVLRITYQSHLVYKDVCLMSYVFIGVGFPMHRDLIWSVVRPL